MKCSEKCCYNTHASSGRHCSSSAPLYAVRLSALLPLSNSLICSHEVVIRKSSTPTLYA